VGLTVAVTGPTGDIGISAVAALEQDPAVDRIIGMARRPFDPNPQGWIKTLYRQGDILDRDAVENLVGEADVVVHLAFVIMGSREDSARVNLTGTRNVFEACVAGAPNGRPRRLVYSSSVAAYGYHSDNPVPLTEDVPPRGSPEHYYSEQKAACEATLAELTANSPLEVFILRPCIVAGPRAHALVEALPWNRLPYLNTASRVLPVLKPPVPDPGNPVQLVHHDDVAAAIALAATGSAPPGAYNLAGDGVLSVSDVAEALGGRPVRVPKVAATAASAVLARLPVVPSAAEWLHIARTSVVMDTQKAKTQLGWTPRHTSAQTLDALVESL
jgi:nucleoside-diphosphate-sugar epimerase